MVRRACALKGRITYGERKALPARAFALPENRAFPIYELDAKGKLVPSGTHAANAKGRARQALNRGTISKRQYSEVVTKADNVLRRCSARGGRKTEEAILDHHLREARK